MSAPPRKVTIIGNACIGKSWLMGTYIENHSCGPNGPTVCINCEKIAEVCNNKTVEMNIWDSPGNNQYQGITSLCARRTDIIILCYDPTSKEMIEDRFKEMIQESGAKKVFLVATKADTYDDQTKVRVEKNSEALKEEWHADFHFITSAFKETGVHELFSKVAECTLEIEGNDKSNFIDISKSLEKEKRCC